MIDFLIDTNICIYAMKGQLTSVIEKFEARREAIAISALTKAELEYGVAKSHRPQKSRTGLDAFLLELEIVPFGAAAAQHYGEIKAHLFRAGTPIGPLDLLIGAHARSLGLTLVTNNRREFDRIPGLRVENWV